MSEPIQCYAIDTYRHNYLKVDILDLNILKVIPLITEYSFVGTDEDDPLNEWKYAYLEEDSDWGYFIKAAEFAGKVVNIDYETLQEAYDERYEDHNDWIDELGCFCEENLTEFFNVDIVETPADLREFVFKSEEDDYDGDEDDDLAHDGDSND